MRVCIGYGFPQYRYVFYSTGYGLPQHMCVLAVFTVHVYTGHGLPQHVCVLVVFTVRVCIGYVLSQHMCVLSLLHACVYWLCSPTACVCASSLQYVGVLVMVSHEHVLTWLTAARLCSWQ